MGTVLNFLRIGTTPDMIGEAQDPDDNFVIEKQKPGQNSAPQSPELKVNCPDTSPDVSVFPRYSVTLTKPTRSVFNR